MFHLVILYAFSVVYAMEFEVLEMDSDNGILELEGMENDVLVSKKDDKEKYEDINDSELSAGLFYNYMTNFVSVRICFLPVELIFSQNTFFCAVMAYISYFCLYRSSRALIGEKDAEL
jgi:hypothetical protein